MWSGLKGGAPQLNLNYIEQTEIIGDWSDHFLGQQIQVKMLIVLWQSLGRWYNNSIDSWRWNVIYIWAFQHHQHVSLLCSHSVIYSVIIMVSWFSSGTSQWLLVFSSNPSYPNHQEQFYVQLMFTDQCWSSQLHHQDQFWLYVRHSHQLLII